MNMLIFHEMPLSQIYKCRKRVSIVRIPYNHLVSILGYRYGFHTIYKDGQLSNLKCLIPIDSPSQQSDRSRQQIHH